MSRQRQKGTSGEREVAELLGLRRTPMGTRWDLERDGDVPAIRILATRPDRGRWLFTVDLATLQLLLTSDVRRRAIQVEVKRHKSFALHSMWGKEMSW